jgi:hypothetical protein
MAAIEYIAVGLIVIACAVSSAWRLMSARLRLRALEALAVIPGNPGGSLLARLRQKTLAQLSGGCGACARATNTVSATVPPANRKSAAPRR